MGTLGIALRADVRLRALLAEQLCEIIDGWKQIDAGGLLGIPQSNISRLRRGDTAGFSIDRLLRLIHAQGYHVEVRLVEMAGRYRRPRRPALAEVRRFDIYGMQISGSREEPEMLGAGRAGYRLR